MKSGTDWQMMPTLTGGCFVQVSVDTALDMSVIYIDWTCICFILVALVNQLKIIPTLSLSPLWEKDLIFAVSTTLEKKQEEWIKKPQWNSEGHTWRTSLFRAERSRCVAVVLLLAIYNWSHAIEIECGIFWSITFPIQESRTNRSFRRGIRRC